MYKKELIGLVNIIILITKIYFMAIVMIQIQVLIVKKINR